MFSAKILVGDAVQRLRDVPDQSVRTVVTSPPYWGLRDYGADGQLGAEETPQEFVESLCLVFDEVWRVLADDGTIWVNLGDSYNGASPNRSGSHGFNDGRTNRDKRFSVGGVKGLKPKDLVGIPWRFAFAMQDRGWYLRQDIIWSKPNPMPESVRDRCTKSHEYIFLMSKSPKYFFDLNAIAEPLAESSVRRLAEDIENQNGSFRANGGQKHIKAVGGENGTRNKRSVWNVSVAKYAEAHFAVYPPELITPCVLAGSKPGDVVLDPFSGSGTTGEVALKHERNYVGVELNPSFASLSERRITDAIGMFGNVEVVK
jgi:DNA modification methylase